MSTITTEDVLKLARLSRLRLSDEEIERFTKEFNEILNYVEQLNEVDVSGLDPTYQVTGLVNVMRSDEVCDYKMSRSDLLANAPSSEAGQFKVKRVLG